MAEITIKDYAERNGLRHTTVKQRCERGCYKTARKLGRDWIIDENDNFADGRVKSGKYKGWRKDAKEAQRGS